MRRPVQHVHAEPGIAERHKVATEGALAVGAHGLLECGVKQFVGLALDKVAADNFGATAFHEFRERLVAVRGILAAAVRLHHERKATVAGGAQPYLPCRLAEYAQVVFADLFGDALYNVGRFHALRRSL